MLLPLDRRRTRLDRRVAASYFFGTTTGALITALAAWLMSGFFEPIRPASRIAILVAIAVLAWMIKHGPLAGRWRLPENRRQIPTAVFARSLVRGAYRFGLEMGTGMRTYVPAYAPYVLLAALVVARPTLIEAMLVAVGFGLARALPLMVALRPGDQALMTSNFLQGTDDRWAHLAAGIVVLVGGLILV